MYRSRVYFLRRCCSIGESEIIFLFSKHILGLDFRKQVLAPKIYETLVVSSGYLEEVQAHRLRVRVGSNDTQPRKQESASRFALRGYQRPVHLVRPGLGRLLLHTLEKFCRIANTLAQTKFAAAASVRYRA